MTNTVKNKKWNDETVAKLMDGIGGTRPVQAGTVAEVAKYLDVSERSVASKLRQMDVEVASLAKESVSRFTAEEADELRKFVANNAGNYTYAQIAEQVCGGKFTAKQVQGKILAEELTGSVKATEKVEAARIYSDAEEGTFISMAQAGKFIEDIASVLNKTIASVRGKALSLTRKGQIDKIPAQKESHAKNNVDGIESLGADVANMTVEAIAKALDKTERGIKTTLTRRGIKVANYDGAAKKLKAEKVA